MAPLESFPKVVDGISQLILKRSNLIKYFLTREMTENTTEVISELSDGIADLAFEIKDKTDSYWQNKDAYVEAEHCHSCKHNDNSSDVETQTTLPYYSVDELEIVNTVSSAFCHADLDIASAMATHSTLVENPTKMSRLLENPNTDSISERTSATSVNLIDLSSDIDNTNLDVPNVSSSDILHINSVANSTLSGNQTNENLHTMNEQVQINQDQTKIQENSSKTNSNEGTNEVHVFTLEDDIDRLKQLQGSDSDIHQVLLWLKTNSPPPKSKLRNKPKLLKYRNVYKYLVIRNDVLWRKYKEHGKVRLQAVVPTALVSEILSELHGSNMCGHYGVQKTVHKALQTYFWPLMYKDISQFCLSCESCQRDKNPVPGYRAPLKSIAITRPMQIVSADIVELGLTSSGNRYVLVVTDLFTKYTNMYPLQRQTAESVAECLFVNYIRQHSIPESILSDQGVQFESAITQSLCKKLGIRKLRTSTAHPQCDGQTERLNRTIRAQIVRNSLSLALVKEMNSDSYEWDQFIPQIEFAYNTTVHSTTGYSPFFMLHARHPRLPVHVMFGTQDTLETNTRNCNDLDTRVEQLCARYNHAANVVAARNKQAKNMQKRYYDRKVRFKEYDIGQLVYMTNPRAARSKLTSRWIGPYKVIQKFNDGLNYKVVDINRISDIPKVVHFNRLKPKYQMHQNNMQKFGTGMHTSSNHSTGSLRDKQVGDVDSRKRTNSRFRQRRFRSNRINSNVRARRLSSSSDDSSVIRDSIFTADRNLAPDRQSALSAASRLSPVRTRSGRVIKPPIRYSP